MEWKFGAQFLIACIINKYSFTCVYNFNPISRGLKFRGLSFRGLKFRGLSFRGIINAGLLRDLTLGNVETAFTISISFQGVWCFEVWCFGDTRVSCANMITMCSISIKLAWDPEKLMDAIINSVVKIWRSDFGADIHRIRGCTKCKETDRLVCVVSVGQFWLHKGRKSGNTEKSSFSYENALDVMIGNSSKVKFSKGPTNLFWLYQKTRRLLGVKISNGEFLIFTWRHQYSKMLKSLSP